jgi:hypothetical protein
VLHTLVGMAPSAITEDYYMILGVDQTARLELIVRSYKRLALKLHPDHNAERDATEAFQKVCQIRDHANRYIEPLNVSADPRKLVRAYETLKDESERRKYDLIYPSLKGKNGPSQYAQKAYTTPASSSQSETLSEAAHIAKLQKSKQERAARWWTSNTIFESSIFEIRRVIRQLEQEIKRIDSIFAAEAAEEAQKNSWSAWLLSPIYKKAPETEEQKALKDRARQERRIEKDMKERRMDVQKAKLEAVETSMRTAKAEKDAADLKDEAMIQNIQSKIRFRENRQRQERERAERERVAEEMRQQREQWETLQRERREQEMKRQQEQREEREREAAEQWRTYRATMEEVERKWHEETKRQQERATYFDYTESTRQARTSNCDHDGWWPKVQGRTACPECSEVWTYLLQCPGCDMTACPRCQAVLRPRFRRRETPRVKTPNPFHHWDWD